MLIRLMCVVGIANVFFVLCYEIISTAEVEFPELTICPNFLEHTHIWDRLCEVYEVCDQDTVTSGHILPKPGLSDTLDLSKYYYNITYGLDDLISLFEVETDEESSDTSQRY